MLNKIMIALSAMIVLSAVSGAFANNSSQYSSPDSTPNGPFFYADTYGVPPTVLQPVHRPRHLWRRH
jgi:hypothetical protein